MATKCIYISPRSGSPTVFEKITDAISMMKNRKEARMRSFTNRQDAIDYSITGITKFPSCASNSVHKPLQQQPPPPPVILDQPSASGDVVLTVKSPSISSPSISADKPAYRGPKSQELVQFRKMIEQGKLDAVAETAWRNPRYLIGSGDTPSILKVTRRERLPENESSFLIIAILCTSSGKFPIQCSARGSACEKSIDVRETTRHNRRRKIYSAAVRQEERSLLP